MRELKGYLSKFVAICLGGVALFHFYTAVFGVFTPRVQRGVHLMVLLPMAFLLFPATKKSPKDRPTVLDCILAVLSVIPPIFVIYANDRLNLRFELFDPVLPIEVVLGVINILLILEAVRRVVVPAMAILMAAFFAYIYIAPFLPGIFYVKPMPLARIIEINYLFTSEGIYGSIVGVTATFVAIFVIFGAFLQNTNTGEYFTNLACKLAGKGPGGPAKIAVISSGLFGSISGVAAANVYATGIFTIPLMKKLGYKPKFAGAVEAAASTGGLIMPPIMGAGAFVMSEITGVPYYKIIIAALLGAVFYYVSLIVRVHVYAQKYDLSSVTDEQQITWKEILKDSYQLVPLVLLVIFLVKGYSPFMAAVVAIFATFALSFVKKETMMTPKKLWGTFVLSGQNLIMLGVTCAGAGMIISIVTFTGLALGVATVISSWSGGFLLPALLLVTFTSILMGMGMPCTPAYIIAVTIGGPAMLAMGVDVLPAHLFVFYYAILAEITPPVCIASYCGANIAQSKPMETGFESLKLALVGFIIPYIFIYNPALLLRGSFLDIVSLCILMVYIICFIAAGLQGFYIKNLNIYLRAISIVVAGLLVILACSKNMDIKSIQVVITLFGLVHLVVSIVRKSKKKILNAA